MTRFGSVCSGIEAASVAWGPLGWQAAWFAEIEPFPCAVLAHHYPRVPNLGDMSVLPTYVSLGLVEAPDVLCGGTPCQAFSVAGLRRSLDDARGNLSLVFCELANAIDERRLASGQQPCVVFWENVPGVLSTKDNAFGCFLAGLAGEDDALVPPGGKWADAGAVLGPARAVAWRTLDAQYFGLAQRRRRVFVVASARAGFDPAAVLLEFDGVRRDLAPSREAREDAALGAAGGPEVAGPLTASQGPAGHGFGDFLSNQAVASGHLVAFGGNNTAGPIDASTALTAHPGGRYDFESETFVTHSLRGEGFDASEDGTGRGTPLVPVAVAFTQNSRSEVRHVGGDGQIVGALAADHGAQQQNYVALSFKPGQSEAAGGLFVTEEYAPTLQAQNNGSTAVPGVQRGMQVRRLTPEECEALQGFPRSYTAIPHRGKPAADGPRYKALGNSWAVPVVRWIGVRITIELSGCGVLLRPATP